MENFIKQEGVNFFGINKYHQKSYNVGKKEF